MPKKILLADDSITIQKVVELTFSDGDYEVTAVNNGLKAIAKLAEIHPDIVLSDIIMPEKNGYEVCEYVKSHPEFRHIPVILLTGTFEPFDPERAEKAGCDAVVTKPFESQNLIHKVEGLIETSRQASSDAMHEASTMRMQAVEAPVEALTVPFDEPESMPALEPVADPFTADPGAAFSGAAGPGWEEPSTSGSSWASPPSPFGAGPVSSFTSDDAAAPFDSPVPGHDVAEPSLEPGDPFGDSASAHGAVDHDESIFEPAPAQSAPVPMPQFEQAEPPAGETRAFPMMSFDDMRRMSELPAVSADPEPPLPELPEETASFDAPSEPSDSPFPSHDESSAASPFNASAEDLGATRAFPSMSFEQLQQMAASAPSAEEPQSAPSFPVSNFEEIDSTPTDRQSRDEMPFSAPPFDSSSANEDQGGGASYQSDEVPAEARAFPAMDFENTGSADLSSEVAPVEAAGEMGDHEAQAPLASPAFGLGVEDTPPQEMDVPPSPGMWSPTAPPSLSTNAESVWADEGTTAPPHFPTAEVPFPEPDLSGDYVEEQAPFVGTSSAAEPQSTPAEEEMVTAPEPAPSMAAHPEASTPLSAGSLSDEQVDRIARRVVELMSTEMVRNIAWEIVPDLAEMIVKERVRQLENE